MPLGAFRLNSIAKALGGPPTFNTISATGGTIEDVEVDGVWYRLHTFKAREPITITANGNAQMSTVQSQFGGSSALFDGSGDYLQISDHSSFSFGTGDFTIEFWYRPTSVVDARILWDQRPVGTQTTQPTIYHANSGVLYYYTNAGNRITGSTLAVNTWYHIAVSRSGTSTRMFVNGTQVGSTYTDSTNYTSASTGIRVGADQFSSPIVNFIAGNIDEIRVSNTARYTANFTSPTAEFVNDANTLFLCHCTGITGQTTFVDDNKGGTSNFTFSVSSLGSSNGVVDMFVLGGGGAGGAHDGLFRTPGGGGAGGLRVTKALLATKDYTIRVGQGGRGAIGRQEGNNGGDSFAFSVVGVGGGGGGHYWEGPGTAGGSGGGGGTSDNSVNAGGAGISGQGYAGGASDFTDVEGGGGGGGAGGVGQTGGTTQYYGGSGGTGVTSNFNGVSTQYAGGGGGAGYSATQNGVTGGTATFGGGAGNAYGRGSSGTAHRGGGGGGGNGLGYVVPSGGDGGSGIVMVRYPLNSANNLTAATLEAVAVVASNTSTASTITIPSSSAVDDYAILFDYSTTTTLTVPSGWTQATTSTTTGIRATVSYKKLVSGDIGASITGMAGTTRKVLLICRANAAVGSITVSTPVQQATTVAPTNQALNISGVTAPVIGFAHYTSTGAVTTRGSTAIANVTTEYTSATNQYVKTFVYNANHWTPANLTISQSDDGTNALQSFYIRFNA